ncbi:MAG: hypothetical protein ACT4OK_14805 [Gemmobacter sp.]
MDPADLIALSRKIASSGKRPRQTDLKRAVSGTYYALFHALCGTCADCLVGRTQTQRQSEAWRSIYRSVDHRQAKDRCRNRSALAAMPPPVIDFAYLFCDLQTARHDADYDPASRYFRVDVLSLIASAEAVLDDFAGVPLTERRSFAVRVLARDR